MASYPLGEGESTPARWGGWGGSSRRLPSERSPRELRDYADELRQMAATATTADVRDALWRLSERIRRLAASKESDW